MIQEIFLLFKFFIVRKVNTLILSPEKREKLSNVLITSAADFSFLRKKVVSSG